MRGDMEMSDIQPDTADRLNGLVGDFVGQSQGYYQKVFAHMLQAPGYRYTLNLAAGLLGPVWFGARGLWSWFLGFLMLETMAFIQIGRGLFGDLGREARTRAEQIAQTLDLRHQQIEAAEASGSGSLDALKRAAESLENALADAQAAAQAADASGVTYLITGIVLLLVIKFIAASLGNWTLEGQFARWRSDRSVASGWSPLRLLTSAGLFLAVTVLSTVKFAQPDAISLLKSFPTNRNWRLDVGDGVQAAFDWTKTAGRGFFDGLTTGMRTLLDWIEVVLVDTLAVCGHDDPVLGHYGLQKLWLVSVADGSGECVSEHLELSLGDYSRNQDLRRYGGDDGPRWLPDGSGLLLLVNEGGEVHLAEFKLADRSLTRLTEGDRVIYAFSADAGRDTRVVLITTSTHPCDLYEVGEGASLRQITEVNAELLAELELCDPIRFRSHSSGVEVDGWVMPPVGMEPGKRYPVILYTGGGPGGMRASVFVHEWQTYAAQGYAVINCNARGNYGYGQDFSAATRGKWGDLDYEDNIAYLNDALEQFDFLDPERLAVAGGSYGGYMATWIIARHPEFKAAVVDRSLVNRNAFYGTGDIGFLLDRVEFDGKLPWEIPETYLERSPVHYVGSIQTPTLVVHSELDHRCPVGNGEQLYISLKRLGVPTELVRFPNETHELSRNGRPWHRVFRMERYLDWFGRWL